MTAVNEPKSETHYASGLSRHPEPAEAVAEVVLQVTEQLASPPSVAVVFVAGSAIEAIDDIVETLETVLRPGVLIGATAVGVIGGAYEVENGDGLALWAATGVEAVPFRLESLGGSPPLLMGLPETLAPGSTLVIVADPYTFPVDDLVEQVNEQHPDVVLVGGLASAPGGEERNRLVLDDQVHADGAVGFLLPPGAASPIVSQGCRPVGAPWVITEANGQLIQSLGGQPAMQRVDETVKTLSAEDRMSAAQGLHVGLVVNDQQQQFDQGDFLIRVLLGADKESGAIAVGDRVEVGQVLQFQIRDEHSASEELDRLLMPMAARSALVFTCNGRGSHLFQTPSHDASKVQDKVGPAVGGMFCLGEIGPIGARNALHGFTATVLAFH